MAVVGTGATGVQTIQEVAKTAGHMTVFQRTPNWCSPLHNSKIDAETMARIKANYPDMFRRCQETFACFIHTPDPRGVFEVTPEEREAFFEKLYAEPGFGIWLGNFRDILTDPKANDADLRFRRPKDPPAGQGSNGRGKADPQEPRVRHPPRANGNQVLRGLQSAQRPAGGHQGNADRTDHAKRHQDQRCRIRIRHHHLRDRISMRSPAALTASTSAGVDGQKLKDKWAHGPQTYLGVQVEGFPNMMMLMGPHTALGNIPAASNTMSSG